MFIDEIQKIFKKHHAGAYVEVIGDDVLVIDGHFDEEEIANIIKECYLWTEAKEQMERMEKIRNER